MATETKPAPTPSTNGTPKPSAPAPAATSTLTVLEDALAEKASQRNRLTFDPALIGSIIAAILPLVQNCFKPTPQSLRRRFPNRVRLAAAIRQQLPNATWSECFGHADDVYAVADEAPDHQVTEFIGECCR